MMATNSATSLRYFIGAVTPSGFKYYPENLYDVNDSWIAYLIKSGSGTGKSTLIRKVIDFANRNNLDTARLLCSTDPNSLDGILIPEIKACVIDATLPHAIEPKYWGANERIVHLGECMDYDKLFLKSKMIYDLQNQKSAQYERCRKFISTAATLLNDNRRMATVCTDESKIKHLAKRIATREFIPAQKGEKTEKPCTGTEKNFFLSAVTPAGLVTLSETIQELCPIIYSIEDEHGASSNLFMQEMRNLALDKGYDIIICPCPLSPSNKIDHLMIPEIGVAFTTSNQWQKVDYPVYRRIHATRFTDMENLKKRKHLLSFNRKAASELLLEAVLTIRDAKAMHESLEEFYIPSMDWKKADAITVNLLSDLEKILKQSKQGKLS